MGLGVRSYILFESESSRQSARSFGWDYDLSGNRTAEHYGTSVTDTSYTADALNRYTAISGTLAESTLAYDADGNLTEDGTWTYVYDGENRLQKMSKSGQTLTFTYDYAGRRIRKLVTGMGAKEVKYLWSGARKRFFGELRGSNYDKVGRRSSLPQ